MALHRTKDAYQLSGYFPSNPALERIDRQRQDRDNCLNYHSGTCGSGLGQNLYGYAVHTYVAKRDSLDESRKARFPPASPTRPVQLAR
jgi:hypothetical protein